MRIFRILCASCFVAVVSGCSSLPSSDGRAFASIRGGMLSTETGVGAVFSESAKFEKEGIASLREGQLEVASAHFNQALKLNARSSRLHFLNAFTYHLRGDQGNEAMYPLAANGYEIALRFEPDNWLAGYMYGRLLFSMRDYTAAQAYLSEAALYQSRNDQVSRDLAAASYYARDLPLAAAIYDRLSDAYEASAEDLSAAALVSAASNDPDRALSYQKKLEKIYSAQGSVKGAEQLQRRVEDWGSFYRYLASEKTGADDQSQDDGDKQEEKRSDPSDEMLAVDVVIIRTQDDLSGSKGVNLLDSLQLQFGVDSTNTSGLSWKDVNTTTVGNTTQTITRAINIPAINYSLNIVNSTAERTRVLANPTLVATFGEESTFFSGVEVDVSVVGGSNSDGDVYNKTKEIGVSLTLTPEKTDEELLKLSVAAERTFLTTPNTESVTYTYRIDTSKTSLDANVVMNYGQTLVLGGLDDKQGVYSDNNTPGLGDVPVLGALFSREVKTGYQKSVLILLTPKRPTYQADVASAPETDVSAVDLFKRRNAQWINRADVKDPLTEIPDRWSKREFRTGDLSLQKINIADVVDLL
jgi:tetratricopeptide (TPR) repeat protein